jgi:hypothetical protein
LILSWLFVQIDTFAQNDIVIDTVAVEFNNQVKEQERILAHGEKIRDSLEKEFYKQPPVITLSFEKNKKKILLDKNFEFWIEKENKRYNAKGQDSNKFLIDSISDTISVVFRYELDTLKFQNIVYTWIQYGAGFGFGVIDNLEEIRKYYNSNKRDDEFNEWTEIGQPYLRLLKNKKLNRQKRKIGIINFLVVAPRVYGDGTIIEIVTVNPKKE